MALYSSYRHIHYFGNSSSRVADADFKVTAHVDNFANRFITIECADKTVNGISYIIKVSCGMHSAQTNLPLTACYLGNNSWDHSPR